jgi:deoxyadenosine/deoxycytidine kinase
MGRGCRVGCDHRATMQTGSLIGVCGPMGAGKSTLVTSLASALGFTPRLERVEANPFFGRFIEDPARWSFWSQLSFILGSVGDAAAAANADSGTVLERPPEEMFGVFVRLLKQRGSLLPAEFELIQQVFALSGRVMKSPDLLVVLHAGAPTLLARLRRRGDEGDTSYSLDSLEEWVGAYGTWRATLEPGRVIDLNVESSDVRSPVVLAGLAAEIEARIG